MVWLVQLLLIVPPFALPRFALPTPGPSTSHPRHRLKSIFSEPRSAKDVDVVLRDFSRAARAGAWKPAGSSGGALLFSVVGAKMSEGINFSDDLAR